MSLNKSIKKIFSENLKEELKRSKEELLKASLNFSELSQAYDVIMLYDDLLNIDTMMYLIGYKSPLRIIADYYKNTTIDYMNFTDSIEMIFNDAELEEKYANFYSKGITLNEKMTNSSENEKNSIFFNYKDKIIEVTESKVKYISKDLK